MTNSNTGAASRIKKIMDESLYDSEEITQELERTRSFFEQQYSRSLKLVTLGLLVGVAGYIFSLAIHNGARTFANGMASGVFLALAFEAIRSTIKTRMRTKASHNRVRSVLLVQSVAIAEEMGRSLALEKLGDQAETAPLRAIFDYLTETGAWNSHDVASYRTVLSVRNMIVHNGDAQTQKIKDESVEEAQRLVGKLVSQLKNASKKIEEEQPASGDRPIEG